MQKRKQISNIIIKCIIWIFAFLFVAYMAIMIAFPKNFDITSFKNNLEEEFYKQTGLEIGIEKVYLKPQISPTISINAKHIIILYPNKKELLKVKDINLKLKVFPLIKRELQIEKIEATRPIISLDIDKNGNCSLDKYIAINFIPQNNLSGFRINGEIPTIELNDYKIKIYDRNQKTPFVAEGKRAIISKNFLQDYKIEAEGNLSQNRQKHIRYEIECETTLSEVPKRIFNTNPFKYIKEYDITAEIVAKLKLNISKDNIFPKGKAIINKLNIELNGRKLTDNYIDIEFLDNQTTKIKSELKTTLKDKIFIEGTVSRGKDKNINLECKAKDIDLYYLKQAIETILNTINIRNSLNEYAVKGTANFDFKIKSNIKNLHSTGIAEIKNVSIKSKKMPYEITDINSRVNFAGNKIAITPTKMYINKTPLYLEGEVDSRTNLNIKIRSNNLAIESLSKIFLPNNLPILKGDIDILATITGNLKTPKPKVRAAIRNFTAKDKKNSDLLIEFTKGIIDLAGSIDEPQGKIELIRVNILPKELYELIKPQKLNILITPKEIEFHNNEDNITTDKILFSGKISNYRKNPLEGIIKYRGNIDSNKIYTVAKKYNKRIQASAKGEIKVEGTARIKGKNANIKTSCYADRWNYVSFMVIRELLNHPSVANIDINTDGKDIIINNFTLNKNTESKEKIISINGKIKDIERPNLNKIRIIIPKNMTISIANLINSKITLKSDLTLDGNIEKPTIQGNLDIADIDIPEYKIKSRINNIIFEQNNTKILMNNLMIGKSQFDISADIQPRFDKIITITNLNLKSKYLDLDEFSENFGSINTNPIYPGIEIPIRAIKGNAEIKTFKISGLQGDNITGNLSIDKNILKIDNIKGAAYGGALRGKTEYNFLKTSSLSEIAGKNAQLNPLFYALTGKTDGTTGIIDYKLKLSTIGTKKYQQLKTGKGYLEYTATRGTMGTLGQFEHFLYAQNLISDSIFKTSLYKIAKAIKPQNTGLYTISKGNMEINNGISRIKSLTVEGPNMSLYITGKINILNDSADIKIYGRISQEVENALGVLSTQTSKTILTNSSQTSIGNLFYNDYNTQLPQTITDAIPPLNPNTGISSRPFEVVIQGTPTNIKAVKSFKWIVKTTQAPTPNTRMIEQKQPEEKIPEPQKNITPQNQNKTPNFMDALPDYIN